MPYENNDYKFIAVLNKKLPMGKLLNALGHISIGLTSLVKEDMSLIEYKDKDGGIHPAISDYPFIVLSAKNGNQIRTLRKKLIEEGLPYNDFTDTMIGLSSQDQQEKTKKTAESDLDYYGIVTFGRADELQPLTKKFSLFS